MNEKYPNSNVPTFNPFGSKEKDKNLENRINIDYLNKVEPIIIEFVKELTDLYPKSIMLSGAHELLHLTECTLKFGPPNTINCFQFEELNRKLMRFFHGKDLIGEEIIKMCFGDIIPDIIFMNFTRLKDIKH
jgi:hypothetical protein